MSDSSDWIPTVSLPGEKWTAQHYDGHGLSWFFLRLARVMGTRAVDKLDRLGDG